MPFGVTGRRGRCPLVSPARLIRDPDRNVIELDAYDGEGPGNRSDDAGPSGYRTHP